jgi:excisionase family DNA binding protein
MAEYIKLQEVARRLGVSEKTARRYVKSGELPSRFIGNSYRVDEADLERFLESARVEPGKGQAPLLLHEKASGAGPQNLTNLSQAEFLSTLSAAETDADLLKLYRKIDAERMHLELAWREDEGNQAARNAFARAVKRRIMVFLTLVEREIALPDPEKAKLTEQLEDVVRGS